MRRKWLPAAVVIGIALSLQLVLLPLFSHQLNAANSFLALLVVMALRKKKEWGLVWGALLGGLSDALFMQRIGFHGVSFTLIGYILGWTGGKMVLSGLAAVYLLSLGAVLLDAALVTALFSLLEHPVAIGTLLPPVAASAVITPLLAMGMEWSYRRLAPHSHD